MKKFLVFLGLFMLISTASAAEFIKPVDKQSSVTIPAGQAHRNLYTAGMNVTINSDIGGDLFAAGQTVNINSKVEQDLNGAGQTVFVNAQVGSDARLAGSNVTVNAPITGDLLVAGANISITSSAPIGGDLLAAGSMVVLDSPVAGTTKISGDQIRINGKVTGNVWVNSSELTFGPNAEVAGKVFYKGSTQAKIESGAKVADIEFTKVQAENHNRLKVLISLGLLIKIIALFIVGWVLSYAYHSKSIRIMELTSQSPLISLAVGVVALVATPILGILLFITFVGYYLGILLFLVWALTLVLSGALAAAYTGSVIMQWYTKSPMLEFNWKTLLLGVIVFKVIMWIPFVGWAVACIISLFVFGSIVRMLKPVRTGSDSIHMAPPPVN